MVIDGTTYNGRFSFSSTYIRVGVMSVFHHQTFGYISSLIIYWTAISCSDNSTQIDVLFIFALATLACPLFAQHANMALLVLILICTVRLQYLFWSLIWQGLDFVLSIIRSPQISYKMWASVELPRLTIGLNVFVRISRPILRNDSFWKWHFENYFVYHKDNLAYQKMDAW